jgi:hypothetical protein
MTSIHFSKYLIMFENRVYKKDMRNDLIIFYCSYITNEEKFDFMYF